MDRPRRPPLAGLPRTRLRRLLVACSIALAACGSTSAPPSGPATLPTDEVTRPSVSMTPPTATPAATASPAASRRSTAGLPDRSLTPGAVDPAVTPANVATTICRAGWSTRVRPPVSYTGTLKRRQIVEYGYTDLDPAHYEEDHLVPLSIGGAPRDPLNLWPEPRTARLADGTDVGAGTKDGFELYLHAAVCDGRVSLRAAQQAMATDWIAAWEAAGRP